MMSTSAEVVVQRREDRLELANGQLSLGFARTGQGNWQLANLAARRGNNWISPQAPPAPLWRARFLHERYLPPDEASRSRWDMRLHESWVTLDSLAAANVVASAEQAGDRGLLTFTWQAIALADSAEEVDVVLQISLAAESPLSQWTVRVENRAKHFSLWEMIYPVIGNVMAGEATTLVVPAGWGVSVDHAGAKSKVYEGHYPSGRCVAQLICLTDGAETLYWAAADKDAYHKRLLVEGNPSYDTVEYSVVQYPASMGVMRNAYSAPYAVDVGILPGPWYAAAKQYRAWALEAPWTAGGPIATRADTAQWIKDTVVWTNSEAEIPDAVRQVVQDVGAFARYLGVPTAHHWYAWHEIPFDNHYPEYFPARAGFKEAVQTLQEAGVRVMPYINGRLWDPQTDSWFADGAADASTKNREQKKYIESYQSHIVLAAMCPSTELWQNKIAGIVERLAGDFGVSGVYVDQIASAPPNLCFDRTHGHPVGGGDFWVRGYERLLAKAKTQGKAANSQLALTTEDAAEAYGGYIDAFLMCNSTQPDLVPLYPLIYSGLFLTFGRYLFNEDVADPPSFRTKVGQMFLWGAQLCWMPAGFLLAEQNAKEAAFLKKVAQAKAANQEYLAFGEMVQPPTLLNELPVIQTKWYMWNPDANFAILPMLDVSMTAVEVAAWRHAREEKWGLFFVNMSEEAHAVAWSFAVEAPEQWQAQEQGSSSGQPLQVGDRQLAGELMVPGLSVRVVELFPKS